MSFYKSKMYIVSWQTFFFSQLRVQAKTPFSSYFLSEVVYCFTVVRERCFELNTEVKQQQEKSLERFPDLALHQIKVLQLKHKDPAQTTSTKPATAHCITLPSICPNNLRFQIVILISDRET